MELTYLKDSLLQGVWQLGVEGLWQEGGEEGGHQTQTAKDQKGNQLLLVLIDVLTSHQNLPFIFVDRQD
jgi:hypothetical protein